MPRTSRTQRQERPALHGLASTGARERVVQDAAMEPQHRARGFHIPDRPFQVGDILPGVCSVQVVAWVFDKSLSQIHRLRSEGKLAAFLLASLGDRKARYSGLKLQQWAEGEASRSFIGGRLDRPRTFARGA